MIVKIVSMKLRTIVKKDFLNIGKCNKKKNSVNHQGLIKWQILSVKPFRVWSGKGILFGNNKLEILINFQHRRKLV